MSSFPLTPIEVKVKNHALLMSTGFLVLLPLGVLTARYLRTFSTRWFTAHWFIQSILSGPVIFAGWALGYQSTAQLFTGGNFVDPHKKIGLALLLMYLAQLLLGVSAHFLKIPSLHRGGLRRSPHNLFHILLGLTILVLAAYQTHYGFTIEWVKSLGGLHSVTPAAMRAWLALVIVFWATYFLGMILLPRQFKQENAVKTKYNGHEDSQLALRTANEGRV